MRRHIYLPPYILSHRVTAGLIWDEKSSPIVKGPKTRWYSLIIVISYNRVLFHYKINSLPMSSTRWPKLTVKLGATNRLSYVLHFTLIWPWKALSKISESLPGSASLNHFPKENWCFRTYGLPLTRRWSHGCLFKARQSQQAIVCKQVPLI